MVDVGKFKLDRIKAVGKSGDMVVKMWKFWVVLGKLVAAMRKSIIMLIILLSGKISSGFFSSPPQEKSKKATIPRKTFLMAETSI